MYVIRKARGAFSSIPLSFHFRRSLPLCKVSSGSLISFLEYIVRRNTRDLSYMPNLLSESRTPGVSYSSIFYHRICSVATHTPVKEADITDTAALCELLRGKCNWDRLTSSCKNIELTDAVVEKVLVEFRRPMDARKALLFFHWSCQHLKLEHTMRSYCLMVHILVCAGLLVDARALLESAIKMGSDSGCSEFAVVENLMATYELVLPGSDVYDLLVAFFSKMRIFGVVMEVLRRLEGSNVPLKLSSYNTLLRSAEKSGQLDMVWEIFEHMVVARKYPSQATIKIVIDALCKEGTLHKIIGVLDRMHGKRCSPFVVASTALALRMIESNKAKQVLILLTRMLQRNMIFDDIAYSLSIFAHCKMGDIEMAYLLLDEMLKRGLDANAFIYTSLMEITCAQGKIEEAYSLLDEMQCTGLDPYDVTYNVLVLWSCKENNLQKGITLYADMMHKGFLPSLSAFNALVSLLCENGEAKKADDMLTTLLDKGFAPDEVTYSNLIIGFGKLRCHHQLLKLYYEMKGKGPSPGVTTYTALINSLCQCGKLNEAENFANRMKRKFSVSSEEIDTLLMRYKREYSYS